MTDQRNIIKPQAPNKMEKLPAKQEDDIRAKVQALRASFLKKQILEKMKEDPAASGRLIQAWLHEDA